jgi:transposase
MRFLGIDLHTDTIVVSILSLLEGKIKSERKKFYFSNNDLSKFIKILTPEDFVVVEATCNAFWFFDKIKQYVKECFIYDSNKLRKQGNKTDKIDSKELANKLMYYIFMDKRNKTMPTVYVPKKEVRELRSLVNTYMLYRKMKTQIKNRIHSLTKQNGYKIKGEIIDSIEFENYLNTLDISDEMRCQINYLYSTYLELKAKKDDTKDLILSAGAKIFKNEIEILLSIKGFSTFSAIVFMSDVGTVERFKNAKKISSYLRTAPRVESSNGKTIIGKVNKESRPNTCTILTQSVIHLWNAGDHINKFYSRVKVGKSAGKVRIAVIRKMIVSAYYMLRKNQKYRGVDTEWYRKKIRDHKREIINAEKRLMENILFRKSA